MNRQIAVGVFSILAVLASQGQAKVADEEAARLDSDLTPMGGERGANADGTIPAWTGTMDGAPAHIEYAGDGSYPADPYGEDKPRLVITAANAKEHADKLTVGQLAMFELRPDTYRIDVYPTHRDAAYKKLHLERARWNATRTELVSEGESIKNWTGGVAFPIPQNGIEVMWNTRTGGLPAPTTYGEYVNIATFSNGSRTIEANRIDTTYAYSLHDTPVGVTEKDLGPTLFRSMGNATQPASKKGEMNMIHDPIDYTSDARKAWTYIPGTRRVRQAPNLGFDTPNGPGGLMTVDDNQGFNGAFRKYDWKLLGKKEIYVPFHNYKMDEQGLSYETLLPVGHPNPDYMRYELRRVWVVEATLKSGERHLYGKRVFYIEEDSWIVSSVDSYDNRGNIYRMGLLPSVYSYSANGYTSRHNMYFDLQSGHYVVLRLVNTTEYPRFNAEPKPLEFYSPSNLRRLGRR